ncbi:Flp family type IVb pilin [Marinobacter sediminum]|uniref:Flp family type IVb pilin n=1 Tax=Marinobacter sediminum TaxID=256323 RepID=UPI00202F7918|nr:Flp family type IVb pilin [Marinobacter sediminum]MCM0611999.1 Flp family type IVb pilin [Marinobacter sediminum]
MKNIIEKFIKDESGASMVEYAVLVALIAAASIVIIGVLGNEINDAFNSVVTELQKGDAESG